MMSSSNRVRNIDRRQKITAMHAAHIEESPAVGKPQRGWFIDLLMNERTNEVFLRWSSRTDRLFFQLSTSIHVRSLWRMGLWSELAVWIETEWLEWRPAHRRPHTLDLRLELCKKSKPRSFVIASSNIVRFSQNLSVKKSKKIILQ